MEKGISLCCAAAAVFSAQVAFAQSTASRPVEEVIVSTTTWNGRSVFTGVGRALALQDIPANLINRVDVFKTRSADQLETGLAGQIDVRTRQPFDIIRTRRRSIARTRRTKWCRGGGRTSRSKGPSCGQH